MDHVAPSESHGSNVAKHVNSAFSFEPSQLGEDGEKGAGTTHASTAVHHHRPSIQWIGRAHLPHKVQEGSGVIWDSMIRPAGVVILRDNPLFLGAFPLEGEGAGGVISQGQNLLNMDADWTIDTTLFLWPVLVAFQLQKESQRSSNIC